MRIEISEEPIRRKQRSDKGVSRGPRPADRPLRSDVGRTYGIPNLDVSAVDSLGAYVAKSCPVRVQLRFAPPAIPPRESPALEPFLQAGLQHEFQTNAKLAEMVEVVDTEGGVEATRRALERGVAVLMGATLPTDEAGHRVGRPDWLVRAKAKSPNGLPGYWPVDIKWHKVTEPSGSRTASKYPAIAAPLHRPFAEAARPMRGRFERVDKTRRTDLLQLAHYWRMLEACGHAPATDGVVWGGIIGTDDVVVWTDLSERRFLASGWTPVDRAPRRRLSALEVYDIEFAFRLDIAATAQAHVVDPAVPLLVEPTKIGECHTCEWWPACSQTLKAGTGDVSLVPGVGQRATRRLRDAGVRSRGDLASSDAAKRHTLAGSGRLRRVDEHADAAWIGAYGASTVYRRRGVGDVAAPRADVEIDLDVEYLTTASYLWGTLLTNRSGQPFAHPEGYLPFFDWSTPSAATDHTLLVDLWAWVNAVMASAAELGLTVAIYCWSAAEQTRLLAAAGELHREVEDLLGRPDVWIDLHAHVKRVALSADGTGLKKIAQAAGFSWRDADPGGMASVSWFMDAVQGDTAAQQRLLAYNEDDVRATRAIREWLSANTVPTLPEVES